MNRNDIPILSPRNAPLYATDAIRSCFGEPPFAVCSRFTMVGRALGTGGASRSSVTAFTADDGTLVGLTITLPHLVDLIPPAMMKPSPTGVL